ncbi:MAG: histidine phosphatase family protein [Verrucomicrobia bacterium]|nr:histidine phosphatase family protein [Verrucomicrobiota bacterium]
MKRLYIVRHAKSSWRTPELSDFERPINDRGKRDAPFMGQRFSKYRVESDLIISSPAKRAISTAKIIAREIGYPVKQIQTDQHLYLADVPTLLKAVTCLKDTMNDVMIFGHNPGITEFAETLSGYRIGNIPTCGVVCVSFNACAWRDVKRGSGNFEFFDFPKKHPA